MSSFLYYLPGLTVATCDRDAVRKAGLGDVFRDCLTSQLAFQQRLIVNQVHANGPGEKRSGVILCAPPGDGEDTDQKIGYYPAEQEWVDCVSFFIGWPRDKRPGPECLRRAPVIPGYPTVLGDGNTWECPIIRRGGYHPNLPQSMGIDAASGQFALSVLREFDWAWELSGELFERAFGSPTLPYETAFDLSVRALSLNYRIGPREASILRILTTDNFQLVWDAAIDFPVIRELLGEETEAEVKKKESEPVPEPAPVMPGRAAETPDTVPVAATSI